VDVFSLTGNAASGAQMPRVSIGVYTEKRFMLSELSQYSVVSSLPTKIGAFGFQVQYFGYALYNETEPALCYSRKLGVVDLGIKFNYRMITIPIYGNKSYLVPELGSVWHITEKVHTGLRIYNPFSSFRSDSVIDRIGYSYSSGIGYEVSSIVFLGVTINKEEDKNVEVNTAMQYQFANVFFAALGISNSNTHARFAVGYLYKSLRIDVTTSWNARLGISPGLMLIYNIPSKDAGL
jgi:hypothetical protein